METIDHKEISADYSTRLNVWTKGPKRSGIETDERRATVSDAFAIIFDAVNGPDAVVASVARETFAREHRTLQQAFIRSVVVPILVQLFEDGQKGYFDARNEGSVEFARRALKDYTTSDGKVYLGLSRI